MSDFKNNLNALAANMKAENAENKTEGTSNASENAGSEVQTQTENVQQQKTSDSEPTKENNKVADENKGKVEPVNVELSDDVVLDYVKKKLNKEDLTSFEDLTKKAEPEYASEFAKKYDEFYKETGGSVEDFNFIQRNVDEKDDLELVREILSMENPEMDSEDINFILEDEYSYDEEFDDDRDIKKKKIAIKRKAAEARKVLKERQEKFKVKGSAVKEEDVIERLQKQAQENLQKFTSEWKESLSKNVSDFDGVNLKVGDDFEFKYSSDDKAKRMSFDTVADVTFNKFVEPIKNDKGEVNQKELHNAIFKLQNFDSILKAAVEQAIEKGREMEIKQRVNPSSGSNTLGGGNEKPLSAEQAFQQKMLARARRMRH